MREVTFTMDVEDPRPNQELPARYLEITLQVLEFLNELSIKGTFFCVGEIAVSNPELIKKISEQGHEIALHSLHHIPLTEQSPKEFRSETLYAKNLLEDITQQSIIGYRAPIFSLTKESFWATEILQDLGFKYSSSVLPASNPLFGFPGVPSVPFRWPSGLLEIPAPVGSVASSKFPFLGGFYFRYLPLKFLSNQIKRYPESNNLWFYCHPYDFDYRQPFYKMRNTSLWVSVLLWMNRKKMYSKVRRLFSKQSGVISLPPFSDQISQNKFDQCKTFNII